MADKFTNLDGVIFIVDVKASDVELLVSLPVSDVEDENAPLMRMFMLFFGIKVKFPLTELVAVFVPLIRSSVLLDVKPVPRSIPEYNLKNIFIFSEVVSEVLSSPERDSKRPRAIDPFIVSIGFVLNENV